MLIVVITCKPRRKSLYGVLVIGMKINIHAQLVGQPLDVELLALTAPRQLLDAAVTVVHQVPIACCTTNACSA